MIPSWVDQYVGIPFVSKGRDADGCDCWGLVRLIYFEKFKVKLPSYFDDYSDTEKASTGKIADLIEHAKVGDRWRRVRGVPKIGDTISFRVSGQPWHVGMVVGDGCFIHCLAGTDSVIEHYMGQKWINRYLGAYRHADM